MAYVYKHIRLDKNEIFYIGVGSDSGYYRANSKRSRNQHWLNITNKHGYIVEIVYDNIDFDEALQKEIELISKYKLISEGGTLVNYTKGGQGQLGITPNTAKTIFTQNIITKEIFEFNSILDASKKLNIARSNINKILKDKQRHAKNFVFSYDKSDLNIDIREIKNNNKGWLNKSSIYITSINNFEPKYFDSIYECVKTTNFGFQSSKLSKVKNNIQKKHKNHIVATTIEELKEKFEKNVNLQN